jgi:hypothetical protein
MKLWQYTIIGLVVSATATITLLVSHYRSTRGASNTSLPYDESAIVKFPGDVPWQISSAAERAISLWVRHSIYPDHYIRMNGYTCVVWKWPTETWDPELKRLSDERRIWVKDDNAEVVPTPPFFLSLSQNDKAKPPRLTANRAAAIAEMKMGLRFRSTNTVEDVGDFFKITFTPRFSRWKDDIQRWEALPFVTYAWVSKSDWSVCGNPFSPVPSLTEKEALAAMRSGGGTLSYDESLPVKIERVADLTILSLPERFSYSGRINISYTNYWVSFCIDNATKRIIGGIREAN